MLEAVNPGCIIHAQIRGGWGVSRDALASFLGGSMRLLSHVKCGSYPAHSVPSGPPVGGNFADGLQAFVKLVKLVEQAHDMSLRNEGVPNVKAV